MYMCDIIYSTYIIYSYVDLTCVTLLQNCTSSIYLQIATPYVYISVLWSKINVYSGWKEEHIYRGSCIVESCAPSVSSIFTSYSLRPNISIFNWIYHLVLWVKYSITMSLVRNKIGNFWNDNNYIAIITLNNYLSKYFAVLVCVP